MSEPDHSRKDLESEISQAPPGASPQMRKVARRVSGPVDHFLHMEASGGIVLLLIAAVALVWANSPWAHTYHDLWHTDIAISAGAAAGRFNLHFVINDCLMTIFFLVAGLEIKRELVEGELSDRKRATLPVAAALGGMLAPALIYFLFNPDGPTARGWGIPMATDIAFAVGVLSLLGKRVPAAMRILLLALAIIDDLGAILVIAIFYTSGVDLQGLGIAAVGIGILVLWLRLGVRPGPMYAAPLVVIWIGLFMAGVHPTLAGVIVGMAIPVKPWLSKEQFEIVAQRAIDDFHNKARDGHDSHALLEPINRLTFASREALSPVVRGVSRLHIWVAFGIMPAFALANAGVDLGGIDFGAPSATPLVLGVALGLGFGKPIGIVLLSWLCVRLGWASLPKGMGWFGVLMVGLTAGIGFTMAIFIAELAFKGADPMFLGLAKLAILIGTAGAAVLGLTLGFMRLEPVQGEIAALAPSDVEKSTEY